MAVPRSCLLLLDLELFHSRTVMVKPISYSDGACMVGVKKGKDKGKTPSSAGRAGSEMGKERGGRKDVCAVTVTGATPAQGAC